MRGRGAVHLRRVRTGRRLRGMISSGEAVAFSFLFSLFLLAVTLFVLWHVIRSAVLSALRQHREEVEWASREEVS
jgi:hypothetical protein